MAHNFVVGGTARTASPAPAASPPPASPARPRPPPPAADAADAATGPTVRLPDRFSATAEAYLAQHGLDVFFTDVVHHILDARDEQPLLAISEYFAKASAGAHVAGRKFAFADATSRNRLAFVRTFEKTFAATFDADEPLVLEDYHQLLCMICPDFPMRVVRSALSTFPRTKLSFATISRAVQLYTFYRRFLEGVECVFADAASAVQEDTRCRVSPATASSKSSSASSAADPSSAASASSGGADNKAAEKTDAGNASAGSASSSKEDEASSGGGGGGAVSFDRQVVLGALVRLFYGGAGSSSSSSSSLLGPRARPPQSEQQHASRAHFESAAARRGAGADHRALCVPPFWALERAVCGGAAPGEATACSFRDVLHSFLVLDGLVQQLRDPACEAPACMIATGAVACDHEARAYDLMEGLVTADVVAQGNKNAAERAAASSHGKESRGSNKPKGRRKSGSRSRR